MAAGDHLRLWCEVYWHHGIDTGEGTVVQYSGKANGWLDVGAGRIEEVPWEEFSLGREVQVVAHPHRKYDGPKTVLRARGRLGEARYGFDHNNCEHFVSWAIEGLHESVQIDAVAAGLTAGLSAVMGSLAIGLVQLVGRGAVGFAGKRVVAGLVGIGPGGVLGGLASLAVSAGLASAAAMGLTLLRQDEALDSVESAARRVGQVTGVAGAAGGTAASLGAVAAAGTVPGLSAAGVMTGLASIGATLTGGIGGLATGLAVVVALPAAAAALMAWSGAYVVRRAFGRWAPTLKVGLPSPPPRAAWRWVLHKWRELGRPSPSIAIATPPPEATEPPPEPQGSQSKPTPLR